MYDHPVLVSKPLSYFLDCLGIARPCLIEIATGLRYAWNLSTPSQPSCKAAGHWRLLQHTFLCVLCRDCASLRPKPPVNAAAQEACTALRAGAEPGNAGGEGGGGHRCAVRARGDPDRGRRGRAGAQGCGACRAGALLADDKMLITHMNALLAVSICRVSVFKSHALR